MGHDLRVFRVICAWIGRYSRRSPANLDPKSMTDTPEAAAISDLLGQAIEKHRGFAFEEAEKLYRAVLERDPAHADALHNLGVLYAIGLGRPLEALPHFEAARTFGPARPQFWFSYVDALLGAGEREMARQSMLLAQAQGLPRIQLQ